MGTYSQEFKDQIVELHRRDGRTFMDLGKEFNLSPTTVANWARAADKRDSATSARTTTSGGESEETDQQKIARLERELARKTEELQILGKALAFFVRQVDR
jgi:transposase